MKGVILLMLFENGTVRVLHSLFRSGEFVATKHSRSKMSINTIIAISYHNADVNNMVNIDKKLAGRCGAETRSGSPRVCASTASRVSSTLVAQDLNES